jgi:hypothetical protein
MDEFKAIILTILLAMLVTVMLELVPNWIR